MSDQFQQVCLFVCFCFDDFAKSVSTKMERKKVKHNARRERVTKIITKLTKRQINRTTKRKKMK